MIYEIINFFLQPDIPLLNSIIIMFRCDLVGDPGPIGYFYSLSVTRIGLIQLEPFQHIIRFTLQLDRIKREQSQLCILSISFYIFWISYSTTVQRTKSNVWKWNNYYSEKFDPCIKILIRRCQEVLASISRRIFHFFKRKSNVGPIHSFSLTTEKCY